MEINKYVIQSCMAKQKLTTKDLAEKCSMRPQNLSNILSRKTCKPATVGRIAEALGVDVTEILAKEGD